MGFARDHRKNSVAAFIESRSAQRQRGPSLRVRSLSKGEGDDDRIP